MGSCLSKKAKEDPNTSSLLGSKKEAAEGSRDPPPTESPPSEEEKVKEVLSETPTRFVRAASSRREPAKVANGLRIEESDLGRYITIAADLCSSRSAGVSANTPSESVSAASTSLISYNTRAAPEDEDDDDERGTAEMKLKMVTKKKMMMTMSSSSVGMPRSRSPAAKTPAPAPAAAEAGKREFRGVDAGCRSGRPSPSPMRSGEMGNHARAHINSSSSHNGMMGERSGGRRTRSVSPAVSSLKSRPLEDAATKLSLDHQHQQRGRHCRSLSSSVAANGRFSPQRRIPVPAGALDLGGRRRGQDGNSGAGGGGGDGDRMTLLKGEGKEESLENPLVSMECFIFL